MQKYKVSNANLWCDAYLKQNKQKQKQPTILPLRSLPEILVIFLSLTFVRRFIFEGSSLLHFFINILSCLIAENLNNCWIFRRCSCCDGKSRLHFSHSFTWQYHIYLRKSNEMETVLLHYTVRVASRAGHWFCAWIELKFQRPCLFLRHVK